MKISPKIINKLPYVFNVLSFLKIFSILRYENMLWKQVTKIIILIIPLKMFIRQRTYCFIRRFIVTPNFVKIIIKIKLLIQEVLASYH